MSASAVMGFRSFDLDALSEQASSDPPSAPGKPADLLARHGAALKRDDLAADRWSDDGGRVSREAAAKRPAAH